METFDGEDEDEVGSGAEGDSDGEREVGSEGKDVPTLKGDETGGEDAKGDEAEIGNEYEATEDYDSKGKSDGEDKGPDDKGGSTKESDKDADSHRNLRVRIGELRSAVRL